MSDHSFRYHSPAVACPDCGATQYMFHRYGYAFAQDHVHYHRVTGYACGVLCFTQQITDTMVESYSKREISAEWLSMVLQDFVRNREQLWYDTVRTGGR